jgi:hypothetical protein
MGPKLKKSEIRQFLREMHIDEMKRFSEFAEKMQSKGMVSGVVAVEFSDGIKGFYFIEPCDLDETLAFCQQLSAKRVQEYIKKQEEYKD